MMITAGSMPIFAIRKQKVNALRKLVFCFGNLYFVHISNILNLKQAHPINPGIASAALANKVAAH